MAVSQTGEDYALPCGRSLEELWDRLEAGTASLPGGHEEGCGHCRTALSGLTALRDATRELAGETVPVPAQLTDRIMAAVRADARRARMLPLPVTGPGPGGQAEVSEQAVAAVLRFAADSVDGIRSRRCTVRPQPDEPGLVQVELALAIRYGTSAAEALAAVRRAVLAAAGARIGLRVSRCDLHVEDVWFPNPNPPEED